MIAHSTLALPVPRLVEGRFGSCAAFTDEGLLRACGVRIAFSERAGGASLPPFDALNLGRHVGDDARAVAENARLLARSLGSPDAVIVQPHQVHGTDVLCCPTREAARALASPERDADAVVVGASGVAALLCFADCVPVIGVAPTGDFFVAHAGWRGVAGRIVERCMGLLLRQCGCAVSDLNLYIGPYIHACHFEVGPDVHARFVREFGAQCAPDGAHIDLGRALRTSMLESGAAPERIADAGVCTVCDGGARFYSYRATGGACGRHGAFAVRMARR